MTDQSQLSPLFTAASSEQIEQRALSLRLQAVLDGDFAEIRNKARVFISQPEMAPVPADIPKDEYREKTLQRIQLLVEQGFTKMPYNPEYGGEGRGSEYINVAELLAHADMSLAVKQGVQLGLFGTSIERLGTEKHQGLIADVISGKLLGGFAMTEMTCGSDVQGTQTEAVYDHATASFTIHTPNENARKTFIGNAALHGRLMVVFAQLKMSPDAESQGVHAFLVPIRDEQGTTLPGVTIQDNGHKIGLNGVDNGIISFDQVKISRDALLNRFGGVDEDGHYKSDIKKKTGRFFKMIGTLVTGRVFVSMAALSGSKNALAAAVHFSDARKVFGETLLDKQATQSRLLPKLAEAYALHFATRDLLTAFEQAKPETETMAAAIKAVSSDRAMETVDEARLLSGGAGYMSLERYGVLRNDMDVFRTFEGDNTVLRMLAAKNQIGRLANKFKDASLLGKFVKNWAMGRKDNIAQSYAQSADQEDFLDSSFQTNLFIGRERTMMHKMTKKLLKLSKKYGKTEAANLCQDDMIAYSDAYAERLIIESFASAVEKQKDPEVRALLKDICDLYAVHTLRRNAVWYLENEHLAPSATHSLVRLEHDLNAKLRPHATALVDAFAIPKQLLAGFQPEAIPDKTAVRHAPQPRP